MPYKEEKARDNFSYSIWETRTNGEEERLLERAKNIQFVRQGTELEDHNET